MFPCWLAFSHEYRVTTPNKITIARICLIPVFVMMALYYGRSVAHGAPDETMRWAAIVVFVIAAASDGVDGYIARRYNQMSKLGVILDPIADKGLLLAGIITLSVSNWQYEFPVWFPVLVIARDAVIVIGAVIFRVLNEEFKISPSWMGKTSTVAQMVAIGFAMLLTTNTWKTRVIGVDVAFLDLPVVVAGFFTLVSGLGYVRSGLAQMHAKGHGEPQKPEDIL